MIQRIFIAYIFILYALPTHAQPKSEFFAENLINRHISGYAFNPNNLFRLALYAELKGKYIAESKELKLNFGSYATISFYPTHCLLKKGTSAFHLQKDIPSSSVVEAMDVILDEIFEQIMLMSNGNANLAHASFVDFYLRKKNIEPFHKLFTRYLLLNYGKYDPITESVVFYSEDLPKLPSNGEEIQFKKYKYPLKIVLSNEALNGYYLKTGGKVYVEDAKKNIWYATGEDYQYNNVTAYKLFIQHLFTQSIQHIAEFSQRRVQAMDLSLVMKQKPTQQNWGSSTQLGSTIIGILKSQDIPITDPEILKYLVYRPFFKDIYRQLSQREKTKVDQFKAYGWYLE